MNWQNRVDEHARFVDSALAEKGYIRLITMLFGSQNYGLDTENSDVDTISIVVPNFKNLVLSREPISSMLTLENNEHALVKDLRVYCKELLKQNPQFVETLYTDFYNVSKEGLELDALFFLNRDKFSHYSTKRTILGTCGSILEHAKRELTSKRASNVMRLYDFLSYYLTGFNYKDCLTVKNQTILDCRRGLMDEKTMLTIVENIKVIALEYMRKYEKENCDDNIEVKKLLDEIILSIFSSNSIH